MLVYNYRPVTEVKMEIIGSYEAKTKLPAILRKVEGGEEFVITRNNKPIARIIPEKKQSVEEAIIALEKLSKKIKKDKNPLTIKEMIEEGRR